MDYRKSIRERGRPSWPTYVAAHGMNRERALSGHETNIRQLCCIVPKPMEDHCEPSSGPYHSLYTSLRSVGI